MRLVSLFLAWLCVMTAVSPADAGELILGLDQRVSYVSNLFKSPSDPIADGAYFVAPTFRLREESEDLSYDLSYRSGFEVYFRTKGIDDWDHEFTASANRVFSGSHSLSVTAAISDRKSIRSAAVDDLVAQPTVLLGDLGRVMRYEARISYMYSFSSRLVGTAEGSFDGFNYTDINNIDNRAASASMGVQYGVAEGDMIGVFIDGSYRLFDEMGTRPAVRTLTLNSSAVLSHEFSPTLSFSIRAGPAFIDSRQDVGSEITTWRYNWRINPQTGSLEAAIFDPASCLSLNGQVAFASCSEFADPVALGDSIFARDTIGFDPGTDPVGSSRSGLTYFARANLIKTLKKGEVSLSYVRSEDATSGIGSTMIRDTLTLEIGWRPAQRWRLSATGSWSLRQSVGQSSLSLIRGTSSGIPVNPPLDPRSFVQATGLFAQIEEGDIAVTQYWAQVLAMHSLSKRMTIRLFFRYIRQETDWEFQSQTSRVEDYVGSVSFRYEFDAFRF